MKKAQNLLLAAWMLFLLLLALFNWNRLWEPVEIGFVFLTFRIRLFLWLTVGGAVVPSLIRLFSRFERVKMERRFESEISRIKSQAFENRNGELDRIIDHTRNQLESLVSRLMAHGADAKPETADPVMEEDS